MKNRYHIIVLSIFMVFMLVNKNSFGSVETANSRIKGAQIFPGVQMEVWDNKISDMVFNPSTGSDPWTNHYTNHKIKNRIIIGIDPTKPITSMTTIKRCFKLTITYKNTTVLPITSTTFTKELSISYTSNLLNNYDNQVVYEFNGDLVLIVKVDEITDCVTGAPQTALANMYIETEVEVERYYKLYKPTTGTQTITVDRTAIDLDAGTVKDELDIHWNYIEGAEEFDLEWTYVNDVDANGDYGASQGLALSAINYDFKNNATRVTVKENHYTIPLTFETGHIVYRVRGVGRGGTGFAKRINGDWSIAESGTLSSLNPIDFYPAFAGEIDHEQNKNWQYIANFAEDGKRKESISYFDGSLRNRQSVSKLNSENQTIVGQRFYDYQGRPAIEVLPAPSDSAVIKFYETYNHNTTGTGEEFTKADFDEDVSSCVIDAVKMKSSSGASKYYSSDNPNLLNENAYIPDANEFPYSQVEYTPDNTGRIRRQGGVGEGFQLESGHETKYFYGQPTTQQELDRLFGSEAGDKGHYKKNMVVDANGQVSISYINMFGKVVGTLLAGNPSITGDIFDALTDENDASVYGINAINADLLNKLSPTDIDTDIDNNHLSGDGRSLIYSQELLVDNEQQYNFHYTIDDLDYRDSCMLWLSCFDCVYDLTIDLVDECGVSIYPFPKTKPIGDIDPDDTTCEDNYWEYVGTTLETALLEVGAYTLTKTLTVNQDALDHYKSIYIENLKTSGPEACFTDSTTIFNNQTQPPCDDVSCQDCKDGIPSLDDYRADMIGPSPYVVAQSPNFYTQVQLDQTVFERDAMVAECDRFCDTYTSICDMRLLQMKMDMTPGNQYGAITSLSTQNLSVFNENNHLPKNVGDDVLTFDGLADWRNPTDLVGTVSPAVHYLDNQGNAYKVLVYVDPITSAESPASNVTVTSVGGIGAGPDVGWIYPEDLTNVGDFLDIWEPQWSDNLVFYHPEFGYYRSCDELTGSSACTDNGTGVALTSDQFDSLIYQSNTYAEVILSLGLSDTSGSTVMTHITIRDLDPYFIATGCGDILADDRTNLTDELADMNGLGRSVAELAAITVQCGNTFSATIPGACTTIPSSPAYPLKNEYWSHLKNYYIATKQKVQAIRADRIALEGSCYSPCIGNDYYSPLILFPYTSIQYSSMVYSTSHTNWPFNPNNPAFSATAPPALFFPTSHYISIGALVWTPIASGGLGLLPEYPVTTAADDYVVDWAAVEQQVDPCSFYWAENYYNKMRRWGTPDDYLPGNASVYDSQAYLDEQQNNLDYQSYLATGNCPLAIQLEGLLNAMAVNGELTATNKLFFDISVPDMNYPEFTQGIFTDIGGVTTADNDFTFSGVTSVGNSVLTLTFNSGTNQTVTNCPSAGSNSIVLTFTTPNPDSYDFTSTNPIVGFINMSATTSTTFEIYAIIDSLATGTLVLHKLTGTTCLTIDGCTFNDICEGTTEANDLAILMTTLLNTGSGPVDFFNTSSITYLPTGGVYESIINNSLLSYMGGTYSATVSWYENTTTDYRLAVGGADKIIVALDAIIPTTSIGVLSVRPNPDYSGWPTGTGSDNTNVIITYDDGVTAAPNNIIEVKALISEPANDDTFLGNCAPPVSYTCQTDEHQLKFDLDSLFSELLAGGDLFNTSYVDLSTYSSLTPLLLDYMGLTGFGPDIYWKFNSGTNTGVIYQQVPDGQGGTRKDAICGFLFNQLYKDPGYTESEASAITNFVIDESNLSIGGAYEFTLTLEDSNPTGGTGQSIYVCETSCFPMANCYPCVEGEEVVELVLNGGIEEYATLAPTAAPSAADQLINADNVTNPTDATPDYLLNDGSAYDLEQITCTTGEGMIGIVTYDTEDAEHREYAQIKLDATLLPTGMEQGHVYNVSYTIKRATSDIVDLTSHDAIVSTNGIGAYFSDGALSLTTTDVLKVRTAPPTLAHIPDHMALNGAVITDSLNCTTINFKYVAKGGEDHIVIGCFLTDAEITATTPLGTGTDFIGYYLIDSVSIMVDACAPDLVEWPTYDYEDPCAEFTEDVADGNGDMIYQQMIDTLIEDFENAYIENCMSNAVETFNILYDDGDYHYTLYYYDQAGNLTRTIPPKGVTLLTGVPLANAKAYRIDPLTGTFAPTEHTFETTYEYNTLNQLVKQTTPDAGVSVFWYDALGRLVLSQNAKQAAEANNVYSYTVYDGLGRISKVGKVSSTTAAAGSDGFVTNFNTVLAGSKLEVTSTYYDQPLSSFVNAWFNVNNTNTNGQENLRNRVSSITYEQVDAVDSLIYDNATHYSYDVHGNVKTLLQEVPKDRLYNQQFKRVDYEYDLISGNVKKVSYQTNYPDEYYHKYCYDADNRITNVYTSHNDEIWNQDAKYFYYPHGPLARTEIGDEKVQTTDYAYTLQGWLKGVNSNTLDETRDMGQDGRLTFNNDNRYVTRDAYSYSLGYFDNEIYGDDYAAIGGSTGTTNDFLASIPTAGLNSFDRNLYNGNIKHMVTTITDLENTSMQPLPQATAYHYDQLNRITGMQAFNGIDESTNPTYTEEHLNFTNNAWDGAASLDGRYAISNVNYDQNGNIMDYERDGKAGTTNMDDFAYTYQSGTNKLTHVDDIIAAGNYGTDVDDQAANNYVYDEIGNLTKDVIENIDDINWTVYGKISDVLRNHNDKDDLGFKYDPNGNRIVKSVKDRLSGAVRDEEFWTNYKYKLDASGNVMTVYKQTFTLVSDNEYKSTITVEDIPMYGSSRIGIDDKDVTFNTNFLGQFDSNGEFEPLEAGGLVDIPVSSPLRVSSDSVITVTGATDNEYCIYAIDTVNAKVASGVLTVISGSPDVVGDDEINILPGTEVCFSTDVDITFTSNREYEMNGNSTYTISSKSAIGYVGPIKIKGSNHHTHTMGNKSYEFSNHLGNVLTVVSDKRDFVPTTAPAVTAIFSEFEGGDHYLFETGNYSSLQVPTATFTSYSGVYSIKTSTIADFVEIRVPVQAGDAVDASVYMHVSTGVGTSGDVRFGLIDLTTNTWVSGWPVVGNETGTGSGASWTQKPFPSYTIPTIPGSPNLAFVIQLYQPAGRIDTYWDDITLDVTYSAADCYFLADVQSVSDYYPFGALMPGRNVSSADYRYGFNGKEQDDEVKNNAGTSYDFGSRVYDPRLGRFLSMDPLWRSFPFISPYSYAANNPIRYIDKDGENPQDVIALSLDALGVVLGYKITVNREDGSSVIRKTETVYDYKGMSDKGNSLDYKLRTTTIYLDSKGAVSSFEVYEQNVSAKVKETTYLGFFIYELTKNDAGENKFTGGGFPSFEGKEINKLISDNPLVGAFQNLVKNQINKAITGNNGQEDLNFKENTIPQSIINAINFAGDVVETYISKLGENITPRIDQAHGGDTKFFVPKGKESEATKSFNNEAATSGSPRPKFE